jgi:hypothetical protein
MGIGCIQAGHFIGGRHNAVLFNEDLVHGQCYHCNIGLKGNWVEYESAMISMYGRERVEEFKNLSKSRAESVKYTAADYMGIAEKYTKKADNLN